MDALTDEQVRTVLAGQAGYFSANPYRRWFDRLDGILRDAAGASYYDGTACHIDLVQWATDPIWSGLTETQRTSLREDGLPHLRRLVDLSSIGVVLLNGRSVINAVQDPGVVDLADAGQMPMGKTTCTLVTGSRGNQRWVGWSTNLQSSFGVSTAFRQSLAGAVVRLLPR